MVPSKLQQSFRKPHARAVKRYLLNGEAERGGWKGALAGAHWNEDRRALPDDGVVAAMGQVPRQGSKAGARAGELQAPDSASSAPKATHGRHTREQRLHVRQEELLEGCKPLRTDSSLPHEKSVAMLLLRKVANWLRCHTGGG